MLRRRLPLIGCLFLLLSPTANAQWSVGLGGYTEMMGHLQKDVVSTNGFFDPRFSLVVDKFFNDNARSPGFLAEFILSQLKNDDSHSALLLQFNGAYIFPVYSNFNLRGGIGLLFRRVSGSGGATTTANGVSGTATAFRPSRTETPLFFSINLGAEIFMSDEFVFRLDTFFIGLLGGPSLQINNQVSIGYLF